MRDKAVEILRVEKSTDTTCWATHVVYFKDWGEKQRVFLNNEALAVVLFEDEMLKAGIDKKVIEKHRQIVSAMVAREESDMDDCY